MNCLPAGASFPALTLPRAPLRIRVLASVLAWQIGSTAATYSVRVGSAGSIGVAASATPAISITAAEHGECPRRSSHVDPCVHRLRNTAKWTVGPTTPGRAISASPTEPSARVRSTSSSSPASSPTSSCSGSTRPGPLHAPPRLLRPGDHLRQARPGALRPPGRPPTLEDSMDDLHAVLDAAGCERAAVFGVSEGGPMSMLFAATYPGAGLLAHPLRDLREDGRGRPTSHTGVPDSAFDRWAELLRETGAAGRRRPLGADAWTGTPSSPSGGGACCARGRARPARSR